MTRPVDFLLVGTSASYTNAGAINSKLDTYLANSREDRVILLNDAKGMLRKYFGDLVIDSLSPSMPYAEKRLLIKYSRAAIFFWDGTELADFVYLSLLGAKPTKVVTVSTTRVVNKDRHEEFDVYIGRGTPWGNPFTIGDRGMDRAAVIDAYRSYFKSKFVDDPAGRHAIASLKGKILGCHCKPAACHGDVIAEYLNSLD